MRLVHVKLICIRGAPKWDLPKSWSFGGGGSNQKPPFSAKKNISLYSSKCKISRPFLVVHWLPQLVQNIQIFRFHGSPYFKLLIIPMKTVGISSTETFSLVLYSLFHDKWNVVSFWFRVLSLFRIAAESCGQKVTWQEIFLKSLQ